MAYQAWSVVFGEQPSASKWNILGTNDESFHDGTGIDNDVIINRHLADDSVLSAQLNVIPTTDANGWSVTDLGTKKIYTKRVTFSQTIGGLAVLTTSSSNFPVGITSLGTKKFFYNFTVTGNAGVLQVVAEMGTGSTAINWTTARTDGSSSAYTGWIDMMIVDPS